MITALNLPAICQNIIIIRPMSTQVDSPALSPSRLEAPYEAKFSRLRQNGSKQHFDITQSVNLNVMSGLTYVLKSNANLFPSTKACKGVKMRCSLLKQLSQRSNRHHRAY